MAHGETKWADHSERVELFETVESERDVRGLEKIGGFLEGFYSLGCGFSRKPVSEGIDGDQWRPL
jgi:hypothetical protein